MFNNEFYPTPHDLIQKMISGIDFEFVESVLEPSAGKGDLADSIEKQIDRRRSNNRKSMIDCIEIDENLQHILTGKGYRVVHNDFLTYHSHKRYDLIVMNPPFSNGDEHLMKALDMQKDGGIIVCILNAETLHNQHTNRRKTLADILHSYQAEITYIQDAFTKAERKTDVEIALVKVVVPEKLNESFIFEELKKKSYETIEQEYTSIVGGDYLAQLIKLYEIEVEGGIRLINEYFSIKPYINYSFESNNYPMIEMKLRDANQYGSDNLNINEFIKLVRYKYWSALFEKKEFVGLLTSNLRKELETKVEELKEYDFTLYNIQKVQQQINSKLTKGVEESILDTFDKLSFVHSWYPESAKNIHYYNGWKTNQAHKVNKKVILPCNGYSSYYWHGDKSLDVSHICNALQDIEKGLNYLDMGETIGSDMREVIQKYKEMGKTAKIPLKYFNVTFYKKGTCHIEFTNLRLLDKLNIFGSQRKNWLPPNYGKVRYDDMSIEEREIINEFQGADEYKKICDEVQYYIVKPDMLMIASGL